MAFEFPDISKNQLMQVGLGLLGSGFGRGQTNPFMAAGQGLVYGQQQDKADAEEQRVQEAREREERLQQAWAGMFGVGAAPASDMAGMSEPAAPVNLTGAFPRGPQLASTSPDMAGMGSPAQQPLGPLGTETVGRTQEGRPMIANPDGSFSTERSITVQAPDGRWVNIPSMFGGREVPQEEAVAIMQRNGWKDPETGRSAQFFGSVQEAEAAARARSNSIPTPSRPRGNPMLAGLPQGMAPLLAALPPEQGIGILMDRFNQKPQERRIIDGADGFKYYEDTGERVLPGVQAAGPKPTTTQQEYDAAVAQGFPGTFMEYKTALAQAGRAQTNITNNMSNTAGGKFAEEFGKVNAQQFFERRTAANDAALSMQANYEARALLDEGLITGAGADWKVGLGKALQQVGLNYADDAIANTEAFVATRAAEVGRLIKMFGAGTGLSDADRDFATKAAAGQITMTEASIRRILDINDKAARNVITNFNKDAANIDPEMSPYPLSVEIPEPTKREKRRPGADIPPPQERQIGTFYQTPKGRAMWTGEQWVPEDQVPGGVQ